MFNLQNILLFLAIGFLIGSIISFIYKQYIPGIILLLFFIGVLVYLMKRYYDNSIGGISKQILETKDQTLFDKLCEKLFSKDKSLYDQYRDMKSKRTQYETQNLCKNYAKIQVGEK